MDMFQGVSQCIRGYLIKLAHKKGGLPPVDFILPRQPD